jgi:hypothetical protein
MNRRWRRFEVMLPVAYNDGRPVPKRWFGNALREVVDRFDGGMLHPQPVEGEWRYEGNVYRDKHLKLLVDVPDTSENRQWMRAFKQRWKAKLEQLELWMVSYRIEVE